MKVTNRYEMQKIADEILLVPKAKENLQDALLLNKMAAIVYSLLVEGASIGSIIEAVTSEYEVDFAVVEKDISNTIEILRKYNVVED